MRTSATYCATGNDDINPTKFRGMRALEVTLPSSDWRFTSRAKCENYWYIDFWRCSAFRKQESRAVATRGGLGGHVRHTSVPEIDAYPRRVHIQEYKEDRSRMSLPFLLLIPQWSTVDLLQELSIFLSPYYTPGRKERSVPTPVRPLDTAYCRPRFL